MHSMTGFSQNIVTVGKSNFLVAIKSVNSRFLDLSIQIPGFLSSYESKIRESIGAHFIRGKIDVIILQKNGKPSNLVFKNDEYLQELYQEFQIFTKKIKLHKKAVLKDFFDFMDFYEKSEETDPKSLWNALELSLMTCIDAVIQERQKEGMTTQKDIESKLDILEKSITVIETYSHDIEKTVTKQLKSKFTDVMGNTIDENRILSEIAVYLARYTINEEIIRFHGHLSNFKASMFEVPCGKKLDFISQELNREANTIASKVLIPEISTEVITIKQAIEDIREQIRNIE